YDLHVGAVPLEVAVGELLVRARAWAPVGGECLVGVRLLLLRQHTRAPLCHGAGRLAAEVARPDANVRVVLDPADLGDAPLGAEVDPALAVEPEVDGRRNRLARAPEGDDQRVPPAIERGEVLRRAGPPAHIECAGVANRVEGAVLRVVQPR